MTTTLAALGHPVEPQARLLNTWILAWQGVFLHRIGQAGQARLRLTAVLDSLAELLLAAQERHRLEAFVYLHRAGDLMTDRQRDETGRELRRSLALYQEINDRWWMIHCLNALGAWEMFNGQLGQAWELGRQALQIAQQLGDPKTETVTLERMSFVAEHRGATAEGVRLAREAVARQSDPSLRTVALGRLTFALLAVGEFEESVTLAKEAVAWRENLHRHIRGTAFLSNTLARGLLHLGRFDEGLAVAQTTVQHWQDAYGFEQPFLLRTVARAFLALGNEGEADRLIQRTVESQRRMGNENLFALAGALVDCAYPALALGDLNETGRTLVEGLRMTQRSEAFQFTCQSLPAAALLLASQNRLEEAAFLNGAIQRYPHLTRSRWYATVALDRLAELLASLPAGLRSAAEEQGQALALPEMTAELLALLT